MKIAIIEDNAAQARELARLTEQCAPFDCAVSEEDLYSCAADFLNAGRPYDLVMIDCLLPDGNGVELARGLRKSNPETEIIYVTAYLEYAAAGYETEALRYLLKPVTEEKLIEALSFFSFHRREDKIVELTGTSKRPIYTRASQIMYIETVKRGAIVRTASETVESRRPLDEFEAELGDVGFFRTKRQFLVGFRYIDKIVDDTLVMRNGEIVKISRRRLNAFQRAMIRYMQLNNLS